MLLKRLRLGLFNGLLGLLLTACASQPAPQSIDSWDSHQLSLERLKAWSLDGKLAISTTNPQGKAFRQSANLNWQQSPNSYTLYLSGPFGQGGTVIKGDERGVSLAQAVSFGEHRDATRKRRHERRTARPYPAGNGKTRG